MDNRRASNSGRPQVAPTTGAPMRKRNRLQGYDYSQQGAHFITVSTQNRVELFGRIVGADRSYIGLSDLGLVVR
jgi:hypothetical protein